MSNFDKIYARVREMNRDWNLAVQSIRDGHPELARQLHRTAILDPYSGVEFGTVTTDGRGILRSIVLDPDAVFDIYEADVINAVIGAANDTWEKVRSTGRSGGHQ
ncbi:MULTISPECIES: hypothetical protein [unclassified Nocardia]|uniref:hypothetical protein n=1 Tax=unclassified Nocardia TaxID=2637762 RepID=UPI001CE4AFFB|nr:MULTISPECIES: hypothetical protein [unclassified Nocardia]